MRERRDQSCQIPQNHMILDTHTHPINGRLSTAWRVLQTEIGLSAPETGFVVGMSSEAQIQVPPFFMLPGQLCPGKLGRNSLKWRK